MTPEFSRSVALDTIGHGHQMGVQATSEECAALARRFGWIAIHRLTGNVQLLARDHGIDCLGLLSAEIERACVATGDPIRETISEAIGVHFIPARLLANTDGDEEIELNQDELDIIDFTGRSIDIGEAVAQSLALSVDPYPRSKGADNSLKASGYLKTGDTGAFSGLKDLLNRS